MKMDKTSELVSQISETVSRHRERACMEMQKAMEDAFEEIRDLIAATDDAETVLESHSYINGLSVRTIRRIRLGKTVVNTDAHERKLLLKEFMAPGYLTTGTDARQIWPNTYKIWSSKDDETLTSMLREGNNMEEIADALQRQPGSILNRIERLGLTPQI